MNGYQSWKATSAAIKEAARVRSKMTGEDLNRLLKMANFDRLLARVFANRQDSEWMLKGGSSLLVRVPHARATKDLDLVSTAGNLDEAEETLRRLSEVDLGDHVRFRLVESKDTAQADNQPEMSARRLVFEMQDAETGARIERVPVDLVVEHPPIGQVELIAPSHNLHPARNIPTADYRLFPIPDQIADKVCATMQDYGKGRKSSRAKDLVDLVVISKTQQIDLEELSQAIDAERLLRQMHRMIQFEVAARWAGPYRALARMTPACEGIEDLAEAEGLVAGMVNPALKALPSTATWIPGSGWVEDPSKHAP